MEREASILENNNKSSLSTQSAQTRELIICQFWGLINFLTYIRKCHFLAVSVNVKVEHFIKQESILEGCQPHTWVLYPFMCQFNMDLCEEVYFGPHTLAVVVNWPRTKSFIILLHTISFCYFVSTN